MITPVNNYVLVEPCSGYTDYKLSNGTTIKIDVTFEREKHAPIKGRIVSLPERLIYDTNNPRSLRWQTEMNLEVGDTVYYSYLSAMNALSDEDPRRVETSKNVQLFIRYDQIFAAERNGEVVVPNGMALIEPVKKYNGSRKIALPPRLRNKDSSVLGIVKYLGEPNKEYLDDEIKMPDDDSLKVGDTIVMDRVSDIPLEYGFHKSIDEGSKLFRVERRLLIAVKN